jgi:hypothetical protein
MATCPNKNLNEWKSLVVARGEDVAFYLWDKYEGNVPESESRTEIVKSGLKATNILQSPKANQFFNTAVKNKITGESFWNKMQADLGIPKEQIELLKSFNTQDKGQLIASLLGNYSYTVEINTSKNLGQNRKFIVDDTTGMYVLLYDNGELDRQFKTREELEKFRDGSNSKFYSNLTVPGGTNYEENEIATPAITPNIKGHAQFATPNGIGWFRSDDRFKSEIDKNIDSGKKIPISEFTVNGVTYRNTDKTFLPDTQWTSKQEGSTSRQSTSIEKVIEAYNQYKTGKLTKTRRILEVQSDLFQKGRDKKELINSESEPGLFFKTKSGQIVKADTQEEFDKYYQLGELDGTEEPIASDRNLKNQFLQLLNQGSNWVTFFVKSIMQDSAKKGYEKVLFPSGDTASKVEGQTTLEEFKKQKEDRIKELEDLKSKPWRVGYKVGSTLGTFKTENEAILFSMGYNNVEVRDISKTLNFDNEINQLKQELERVDREGFGALKPIYNFYETTVTNILKKQGYSPQQFRDEYGNTWNEIEIIPERENQSILFQQQESQLSTASPEILSKVKEILKKMGVNIESLTQYAKTSSVNVSGVNALADLVRGVIAVAEGKEDVALTEEMVHVATAIIEQKNPSLVTEMISKIDRFKIYKQTLEQYKNNKAYQLPNGKPDIRKIKKEAVDRLISELIINGGQDAAQFPELLQEENRSIVRRWWNAITDFFRGMYKSSNISIFEETAKQIIEGEIEGQVSDIVDGDVFFQLAEPTKAQKEIQRRIIETRDTLRKEDVDPTIDPLTIGDSDASNFYEYKQPDGTYKRVLKRVTDRVKRYYKDKFGEPTFTKEEKAFNEFKRNLGIKYHGFFEEIHYRYFNLDGTRKTTPDARPDIRDRVDAEVYAKIENYYTEMIEARSKGGKNILVFSEARVYDAREKEAGTIDLLIVDEDGTGHIVDWKFMSVGEGQRDVQWYKQEAYGIQLRRYRDILLTNYGVKKVGMNRAVPILFQIKPADKKVESSKPTLTGINIGSVDTTKIENLTLVPVSEKTESTGFKSLDKFIGELNAILDRISKTKATSDEEREFKRERLNIVREAIRMAQGTMNIKPVIDVVLVMMKEGENLISDYNMIYKDANAQSNEFTNEQLSDFSSDLRDYLAIAKVFGKISDTIGDLIYNKEMDKMGISEEELADRKAMLEDLSKNATEIRKSREQVYEIAGQFADKYMGLRNLVTGLLNPAAVVKGLGSLFRSISEIPLASVQILYKLTENAKVRASADAKDEVQDLMKIREKLASRGGDLRQLVKKIYRKDDKGNFVNKLIYKYSPEFRDGVKNNSLEDNRSKQWLKDNVDVEAYLKEADALLEKRVAQIEKDYANNEEMKDRLILQERQKWDLRRADFTGWNNYVILRHPKDKWLSEEYKELEKDPELLELYNFISKINEKAKDVGYLSNQGVSTFLPWVRKSMAESLAWDFSLSTVMNFGNKLSIRADDVGYGNIDALTGEVENGIPKYYTTDFTQLPGGEVDTSEVSEDLFANMILYIGHMNNYKYLSEVEDQIKLVKDIETFKEHHLQTSRTGNVVVENGRVIEEKGNEENAKIYDQFMRAVLYDQKYPLDDTDVTISTGVVDYMKKAINKTAKHFGGKEIFTIDDNPSSVSLVKSMETMNRYFQLKALGFEFVSGAVNWFGTNVQLAAQSGVYFNSGEVLKKQYEILGNNLSKEKQDIFVELIDKFMPLREDPNYEALKKAGMTALTRQNFGDALMFFMRQPEQFTEKAVFMTLLDNIMVQDGKFVNIRDVVKRKYRDEKKGASVTRLKEIDKEIESEIEQLKKEQSIGSTMKMEDGNLVIPGFDLNNRDEIQRLTRLTRRISTNATGGINAQNVNRAQMNIWMKSAMIFKNWIPGLAFTRFDHLKKVSDDFSVTINEDGTTEGERYDIGRLRLFMYVAGTSIVQLSNNINNILTLNEDGMVELDRMFEKFSEEYLQRTGETLNMTREEFIDLIRTNLRNQMKELALTLSLIGLSFSMGLIGPDDDDTRAEKNAFRYSQRIIDKFVSELTFFINPFEFQNILEGNLLPAIGVVTDITRFGTHLTKEVTGFDVSDPTKSFEEVKKDAQPIKNLAKMFPLTKSLINYAAMIDEEFAKEYDITVSKTPGK